MGRMTSGMLWSMTARPVRPAEVRPGDPKFRDLPDHVRQAAAYYTTKYGFEPNECHINRNLLTVYQGRHTVDGVGLVFTHNVPEPTLWVGRNDRPTLPPQRAPEAPHVPVSEGDPLEETVNALAAEWALASQALIAAGDIDPVAAFNADFWSAHLAQWSISAVTGVKFSLYDLATFTSQPALPEPLSEAADKHRRAHIAYRMTHPVQRVKATKPAPWYELLTDAQLAERGMLPVAEKVVGRIAPVQAVKAAA